MDKKRLKQYRALAREEPKIRKDIDRLYERLEDVPVVLGKVSKSGDEFPYIQGHMTVETAEPKVETEIKKQIRIKEARLEQVERERTEIEQFIADIPDSTDRQIFEMLFIRGKRQQDIAEEVGYSQGRISQIIRKNLKD